MATTESTFDPGSLTAAEKRVVDDCASEIREFVRKTGRDGHRIGRKLKAAKKLLGHGRFLAWLRAEFGWSVDTAERLMKVAERFTEIPHRADIGITAMYLLAGDGVPEEARKEAVDRATAGEAITVPVARAIAAKYKAAEGADVLSVKKGGVPPGKTMQGGTASKVKSDIIAMNKNITAPGKADAAALGESDTMGVMPAAENETVTPNTNAAEVEKRATVPGMSDLTLLLGALLPFVTSGQEPESIRAVEQLVRGWPAERTAGLVTLAREVERLMGVAVTTLQPPDAA